jgi:16S rRNA C1402 (ribose-2'-O) methylase RsmI
MSGKLYIVPTPIGNLQDMTFRAVEVLKNVDIILAEDTRQTKKLTSYYQIDKPLWSHHKFNEQQQVLLKSSVGVPPLLWYQMAVRLAYQTQDFSWFEPV